MGDPQTLNVERKPKGRHLEDLLMEARIQLLKRRHR
jgi:hypothetical protein